MSNEKEEDSLEKKGIYLEREGISVDVKGFNVSSEASKESFSRRIKNGLGDEIRNELKEERDKVEKESKFKKFLRKIL
jgi:hypothetical protein